MNRFRYKIQREGDGHVRVANMMRKAGFAREAQKHGADALVSNIVEESLVSYAGQVNLPEFVRVVDMFENANLILEDLFHPLRSEAREISWVSVDRQWGSSVQFGHRISTLQVLPFSSLPRILL
jgi:hypothetical protein